MPRPEKFNEPARLLRQRIAAGLHGPGDKLPSEAELAGMFDLSRNCIRRALATLQDEGLVVARHGHGHFVNDRPLAGRRPCKDTAFIMGIYYPEWEPIRVATNRGIIYTLLEQHVQQQGCRFTHIQWTESAKDMVRAVADTGAPWVICDPSLPIEGFGVFSLLWHLLEKLDCRVVMTAFTESLQATRFDMVGTDWEGGMHEAVKHLVGRGHRRILYAGLDGIEWSDDRRAAFLSAMHRAGLWPFAAPEPVVPYPDSISGDARDHIPAQFYTTAAANLLARLEREPADAVICANDRIVQELAALKPLAELPALVGFDNSAWAREHGLTSVGMDLRRHADAIFDLLAAPPAPHTRVVRVPTLLAVR
jgi:GntR family transcriptional regulator of arabinose operon